MIWFYLIGSCSAALAAHLEFRNHDDIPKELWSKEAPLWFYVLMTGLLWFPLMIFFFFQEEGAKK